MANARAGMGRDFVPRYPSPYYPLIPVTIALQACPQIENIHLNETNNLIKMYIFYE